MKRKNRVKALLLKLRGVVTFLVMSITLFFLQNPLVYAGGTNSNGAGGNGESQEFDFLTGDGNGAFDGVNDTIQGTAASGFKAMRTLGISGLAIAIVLVAIGFMMGGAAKKDESKTKLVYVCIGGALIFGVVGIMGIIQSIGVNIK